MPKVKTKRVIVCRQVYGKCSQLHLMEIIMLRKFIQFALRELNFTFATRFLEIGLSSIFNDFTCTKHHNGYK